MKWTVTLTSNLKAEVLHAWPYSRYLLINFLNWSRSISLLRKCSLSTAPAHLFHEFSHSRDFYSYNTRHRDLRRKPLAKTIKYQGSFRFSGAKFWNTLPLDLTSEHDINKKNRGVFWQWIRHRARKRSAAKIFPKLTQVSLLVGYENFVGSVWFQIKEFAAKHQGS